MKICCLVSPSRCIFSGQISMDFSSICIFLSLIYIFFSSTHLNRG